MRIFYLSIDSHTRFREGWDTTIVRDYRFLAQNTGNNKIIISCRYDGRLEELKKQAKAINIYLETNWQLIVKDGIFPHLDFPGELVETFVTDVVDPDAIMYKSSMFLSTNFCFTHADFIKNDVLVGYHALFGDELEVSLVAYCNGYDIYYPVNKHLAAQPRSETTNRTNRIYWSLDPSGNPIKNRTHDTYEMCVEVLKLLFLGENAYLSLKDKPRDVESYWKRVGFTAEHEQIKALYSRLFQ